MGLLQYYFRRFFRSHFKPVNPSIAKRWHFNSSIMYLLTAWTAFGFCAFQLTKDIEENNDEISARVIDPYAYMRKFGTSEKYTLLQVTGTTVKKEVLTQEEIDKK